LSRIDRDRWRAGALRILTEDADIVVRYHLLVPRRIVRPLPRIETAHGGADSGIK
jgi:hypothetical protein